jgi:hypothetical protein
VKRAARRTVVQLLVAAVVAVGAWMFYRQTAMAAQGEDGEGADGPGSDVDRQGDRERPWGDLWRAAKRALGIGKRNQ